MCRTPLPRCGRAISTVVVLALLSICAGGLASRAGAQEPRLAPVPTTGVLYGRVLDPGGRGIERVEVRLEAAGRSTTTDATGAYRFERLAARPYRVSFYRLGYAPQLHEVSIEGERALDVALTPTPFVMQPVVVTGTAVPTPPAASPLTSAVLSGDDLRRNQNVSLAHAVEGLPGMRALTTGGQVGKPVIRGLSGPRVLVLDDGARLEDYSWSDEDGPSVDVRQAERVEIVRGPASILYGSEALGGVVNAVAADLPGAPHGPSFVRRSIEAYGASNNREFGSGLRLEGARGRFGWRAHGIGQAAGDLRTPDGRIDNTGFFAVNGEGALGVRGSTGSAQLRYVRYGGEFKLLEADKPPSSQQGAADAGPERKLSDDRIQMRAHYRVSGLDLEAQAQWQRHNLIEVADDPNAPPGTKKESEQFDLLLNTTTLDLRARHARGPWSSVLGTWGMEQSNATRGPIAMVPDAHVAAGAVYALEQVDLGRWSLLGGARVDLHHLDTDGNPQLRVRDQLRNDTQVSGNAGVVFRPVPRLSVAANAGRAWRAPTLFELFSNGPLLAEARYEIGRADLAPETGIAVETRLRWEGERLRGEVAGFRDVFDNYIFIAPTNESRESMQVYRHTQADADLVGIEAGAEVRATDRVLLQAQIETVRGNNRELDEPLPLVPPLRSVVGGSLRFEPRAEIGAEVEMVWGQDRLSRYDLPTSGYALLHLRAGIERVVVGRPTRFDLSVRDATDTSYRSFLSRYKPFAPDPGRDVRLGVSTEF